MKKIGSRVVRGPDWKWKEQDGGEGHVGTIVQHENGSARIVWDMGTTNKYRAGHAGKYDLLIYDSAPAGLYHRHIICDTCFENGINGIRWKCNKCEDFDMCSKCYMGDKHVLQHTFRRYDTPHSQGFLVPCRLGAVKLKAWGMFNGAKVVRGKNMDLSDTNDTSGVGEVTAIRHRSRNSERSAVEVRWPNGNISTYSMGLEGKVDLKCKMETEGGSYYRDHLSKLGKEDVPIDDQLPVAVKQAMTTVVKRRFKPGDKVLVKALDIAIMEAAQEGHGGWNAEMPKCIGMEGIVLKTDDDDDVNIAVADHLWCFNSLLLELVEEGNPDDVSATLLAELFSEALLGAIGDNSEQTVLAAAKKGDLATIRKLLNKHPEWVNHQCTPGDLTALQIAAHEGHLDVVDYLVAMQAELNSRDSDGDSALLCAAHGNQPEVIKLLLSCGAKSNLVNNRLQTGMYIAAGKGYHKCVEMFLLEQYQCNPNMQDADGDTALHMAINKDYVKVVQVLIDSPMVDLTISNLRGFNALHHASLRGSAKTVELIIMKNKQSVNCQKEDGFTALHIAVVNNHVEVVKVLIKVGNLDLEVRTLQEFTALMCAVEESYRNVVELLVESGAHVNSTDSDGNTCLHKLMIKQTIDDLQGDDGTSRELRQLLSAAVEVTDQSHEPNDYITIALYLVIHGANLDIKNKNGKTALQLNKNPHILKLLTEAAQSR